jgi:hypothetical protein
MPVAEAKRRRLLRLAGAMALVLAPRGVGVAAVERLDAAPLAPRPGSIPVSAAALPAELSLDLEPPDLLALALRASLGPHREPPLPDGGGELPLPVAATARPAAAAALSAPAALAPAAPVGEPPAALLLSVAAGGWLAVRGARQLPKRGGRFSRNASMPSTASASSRLSAITAPASR